MGRHATVPSTLNMGAACGQKEPEKYPEVDHSLKPIKAPKGGMTKEEMEASKSDPEMAKKLAERAAESSRNPGLGSRPGRPDVTNHLVCAPYLCLIGDHPRGLLDHGSCCTKILCLR